MYTFLRCFISDISKTHLFFRFNAPLVLAANTDGTFCNIQLSATFRQSYAHGFAVMFPKATRVGEDFRSN
jgi:hypothetical protein